MLVPINSREDLEKVLALQRAVAKSAQSEIVSAAQGETGDFVQNASKVLEKYARYSTFTEYQKVPHLADAEKWGATFGVTAILAILIIQPAHRYFGGMSREDLPLLYMQFLEKLRNVRNKSIVLDDLTKAFAVLSEAYGICYMQGDKLALTVVGSRVLLHLLDSEIFVQEAAFKLSELTAADKLSNLKN